MAADCRQRVTAAAAPPAPGRPARVRPPPGHPAPRGWLHCAPGRCHAAAAGETRPRSLRGLHERQPPDISPSHRHQLRRRRQHGPQPDRGRDPGRRAGRRDRGGGTPGRPAPGAAARAWGAHRRRRRLGGAGRPGGGAGGQAAGHGRGLHRTGATAARRHPGGVDRRRHPPGRPARVAGGRRGAGARHAQHSGAAGRRHDRAVRRRRGRRCRTPARPGHPRRGRADPLDRTRGADGCGHRRVRQRSGLCVRARRSDGGRGPRAGAGR